jgi:adenylosuccinate lyase
MLKRYTLKEMDYVWSEDNKFRNWLLVEIAVLKARQITGEIEHDVPIGLIDKIQINPAEINRIEKEITKHDVVAFLNHISPQFPEELRPWLHRGLTSYDIGDTAMSLQLMTSVRILISKLKKLMTVLEIQAMKYKYVPEIGRTHGIHAEPITFGVKLANWYAELSRHEQRLNRLYNTVAVGKISGAVGMYTIDPKIEIIVCKKLRITPITATQIISRDIIAEYMSTLGNLAASIYKISNNLRLLSQTEIREIMEPFSKDQKGSSAMPHKKNPVKSEQLCALMRVAYNYVHPSYENLANCWHERSLDNSASERIIVADISILVDYGLTNLAGIIENMRVFPDNMEKNIDLTNGLIFSQEVMMLVAESGMPREEAHTLVRDIALDCWEKENSFFFALLENKNIMQYIAEKELCQCFDLEKKLRYVDYIFDQVFK